MPTAPLALADVALLGVDIDGTLTDGILYWGGPEVGWTQSYSVRDGEALVRLARRGLPVVPISRNKSACARARMVHLGLPTTWVGVDDKVAALAAVAAHYGLAAKSFCYIGDGQEDCAVFAAVGHACCVGSGHPRARAAAHTLTQASGGNAAVEELIDQIMAAKRW